MLFRLILLLVFWTGFASGEQNSTSVGGTVRVSLSDYSNPHQVLSETGSPCDSNNGICDPVFLVEIGTQKFSFEQSKKSKVFDNAISLNGEFFTVEFRLLQELPDYLQIRVKIEDNDAFDPVPQLIGQYTAEYHQVLPTVPGRFNSSLTRKAVCTPSNGFVRFSITIEIHCLPELYGRRCSTQCRGQPIYPICEKGDVNCENSLEIIGCTDDTSSGGVFASLRHGSTQLIFIGVASAIVILIIATISVFIIRHRRQRLQIRLHQQDLINIIANSPQQQQQQLQSWSDSAEQSHGQQSPRRTTAGYRNPLYHQHQNLTAQTSAGAAATTDGIEEVYEEVEDAKPGQEAPPLPPKD